MNGKTTTARPAAAARHAHLAARGPVMPGSPPASGTGVRVPPFAARWRGGMNSQWPLQSFLELGALDGAVPSARLHARHVLWEWGLASLSDSTELVVSELVTNGVQASCAMAQAAVRLWLVSDRAQVVVLVWDASPQPPLHIDISDDSEHGRGLLLVEAISDQWGWYFPGDHDSTSAGDHQGKLVWAIVRLPNRPIGSHPHPNAAHDDQPRTATESPTAAGGRAGQGDFR